MTSHDQGWGGSGQDASPYSGSYTWFDAFIIPAFRPAAAEDNQQDTAALVHRYNEYYDVKHRPRFEAKEIFLPSENKLGSNKVAHREPQTRCITWHYLDEIDPESEQAKNVEASEGRGRATLDGRVVRGMEVGDQISVWARARFPGWANYVDHLGVRVFWAV